MTQTHFTAGDDTSEKIGELNGTNWYCCFWITSFANSNHPRTVRHFKIIISTRRISPVVLLERMDALIVWLVMGMRISVHLVLTGIEYCTERSVFCSFLLSFCQKMHGIHSIDIIRGLKIKWIEHTAFSLCCLFYCQLSYHIQYSCNKEIWIGPKSVRKSKRHFQWREHLSGEHLCGV